MTRPIARPKYSTPSTRPRDASQSGLSRRRSRSVDSARKWTWCAAMPKKASGTERRPVARGERDATAPRRHAKLVDQLAVGRVPPEQRRQQCAKNDGPDDDASHRLPRERLAGRQLEGPEEEPRELQAPRDPGHHGDPGV